MGVKGHTTEQHVSDSTRGCMQGWLLPPAKLLARLSGILGCSLPPPRPLSVSVPAVNRAADQAFRMEADAQHTLFNAQSIKQSGYKAH